ncbi:DUF6890 family protein [Yersinia entomophaga]|uniref:DUF6890 family protein n=1 Tax=Yersinia TaxID=629 RepID=UPI0039F0DD96
MENNSLEQFLILRRHYLPHENDEVENLARALWLDNRYWENTRIAIANGIGVAFKGE